MRHPPHVRTSHLTQEGWLKLLVGKETLADLKTQHGDKLNQVLGSMYSEYLKRTNETLLAAQGIGEVKR